MTDGALNATVRVNPASHAIRSFLLRANQAGANLDTATFDHAGTLWCASGTRRAAPLPS
jgi:streptogramin lyase